MLSWNQKWKAPSWESATADPDAYVRDYATRVQKIPRVQGVWALVSDTTIDFYTLIEANRDTERQIHDRELAFFDAWPDAPVRFHIYRNESSLREQVGGTQPVLLAA
jgi:hypothetical protein